VTELEQMAGTIAAVLPKRGGVTTLTFIQPEGVEVGGPIVIAKATRVTWRSYIYGHDRITENLQVVDYCVEDGRVSVWETFQVPGFPPIPHRVDPREPAVVF
jgi:hypothetical protein